MQLIRSSLGDLQEELHKLKIFDSVFEINTYLDDLECQIIHGVESDIKRLNELKAELVDQINCYRNEQISSCKE